MYKKRCENCVHYYSLIKKCGFQKNKLEGTTPSVSPEDCCSRWQSYEAIMLERKHKDELKELELWSAKNLVLEAMKNDIEFYQEFMNELRDKLLLEKVKIKIKEYL